MAFTHEPRAPYVPEGECSAQRYFGSRSSDYVGDAARVMRFAGESEARLDVRTPIAKSRGEIAAYLTPAELRELAQRLLDAAHDIEATGAEQ